VNKSGTFHTAQRGFDYVDAEFIRKMSANAADFVIVLNPDLVVERVFLGAETVGADQLDDMRTAPASGMSRAGGS